MTLDHPYIVTRTARARDNPVFEDGSLIPDVSVPCGECGEDLQAHYSLWLLDWPEPETPNGGSTTP
jgi:hypothetical protein